ncbi:MAG: hypothetical protein Q7S09_03110 [bacterium]|nr:hypothetical protein [bacterium]
MLQNVLCFIVICAYLDILWKILVWRLPIQVRRGKAWQKAEADKEYDLSLNLLRTLLLGFLFTVAVVLVVVAATYGLLCLAGSPDANWIVPFIFVPIITVTAPAVLVLVLLAQFRFAQCLISGFLE